MARWQGRFILLCVALLLPIPAFTFHRLPSSSYVLTRPRSTILSVKKNVETDSTFAAAVLSTLVAVQPAILSFAPQPTIAATPPSSYREKAAIRAAEKESRKNAIKDSVAPSVLETGASKAKAAVPTKALSYTEKYEARKAMKASKAIVDETGGKAMGKQTRGGKTVLGSKKKQAEVDALRRKLASDKAKEKRQIEQIKIKKKQQNQKKADEDRRKKEKNIARISAEKKRAEKEERKRRRIEKQRLKEIRSGAPLSAIALCGGGGDLRPGRYSTTLPWQCLRQSSASTMAL